MKMKDKIVKNIHFQSMQGDTKEIEGIRMSIVFNDGSLHSIFYPTSSLPMSWIVAEVLRKIADDINK
jgi:hypothetical protein